MAIFNSFLYVYQVYQPSNSPAKNTDVTEKMVLLNLEPENGGSELLHFLAWIGWNVNSQGSNKTNEQLWMKSSTVVGVNIKLWMH